MKKEVRDVVFPSQFLGDVNQYKAGQGTFVENGKIYAERIGIQSIRNGVITVTPLMLGMLL